MGMQSLTKADIFQHYGVELTRFATSLVGPSEAQDVVSEALLRSMWSDKWVCLSDLAPPVTPIPTLDGVGSTARGLESAIRSCSRMGWWSTASSRLLRRFQRPRLPHRPRECSSTGLQRPQSKE